MTDNTSKDGNTQRRAQDMKEDLRKMDAKDSDYDTEDKGPTGTPPHRADTHWDTAAKAATGAPLPEAGLSGSHPEVPDKAGLETVAGGRKPEKSESARPKTESGRSKD